MHRNNITLIVVLSLLVLNCFGTINAAYMQPQLLPLPQSSGTQGSIQFLQPNVTMVSDGKYEVDSARAPKRTDIPVSIEVYPAQAVVNSSGISQPSVYADAPYERDPRPVEAVAVKPELAYIIRQATVKADGSTAATVATTVSTPKPERTIRPVIKSSATSIQAGLLLTTTIIMISTGLTYSFSLGKMTMSV